MRFSLLHETTIQALRIINQQLDLSQRLTSEQHPSRGHAFSVEFYLGAKQEIPYGVGSFRLFAMDRFRKPHELNHPGN
jgi:hypothetical protein